MKRRHVVLLDRDGTLIVERHYLSDPRQVELIPGVGVALRRLQALRVGLVVVTNQSAVGRGMFDRARLESIHQRLRELLAAEGVYLDGIYYCPHTPDDGCLCRKPQPALVEQAARELGFRPQSSWVIGDKSCDLEMGRRVGATTVLVRTGYGAQVAAQGVVQPDHIVESLQDVVPVIERGIRR